MSSNNLNHNRYSNSPNTQPDDVGSLALKGIERQTQEDENTPDKGSTNPGRSYGTINLDSILSAIEHGRMQDQASRVADQIGVNDIRDGLSGTRVA